MTIDREGRSLAEKTWEAPVISDARREWEAPKLQRLAGRETLNGGTVGNDTNSPS
jgi:hypothetical protein